jgi:hypothetical protein
MALLTIPVNAQVVNPWCTKDEFRKLFWLLELHAAVKMSFDASSPGAS